MNTFTIDQIRQNADLLFSNYGNEPVLLKKGDNQMFLVMPLLPEQWEEIFMVLMAIKSQIAHKNLPQKKVSFEEFDKKWSGFMKNVQLPDNWREDYINDKMKKHQ